MEIRALLDRLDSLLAESDSDDVPLGIPLPGEGIVDLGAVADSFYKARGVRGHYFGNDLFIEPAWDIMLSLFSANQAGNDMTVSGAGLSGRVPLATGLRWIKTLEEKGIIERHPSPTDNRLSLVRLTPEACEKMSLLLLRLVVPANCKPAKGRR